MKFGINTQFSGAAGIFCRAARVLGVLICGIAVCYVGLASATPSQGVSGEILSEIVADHYLELKVNGVNFEPETPFILRTRLITMGPGGHGGWHSHSGPVMVSVLEGVYTFYDASDPECEPQYLEAGEGWISPGIGVHVPTNQGDVPLVFIAVFFVPEGEPIRIDQDQPENPNCPVLPPLP